MRGLSAFALVYVCTNNKCDVQQPKSHEYVSISGTAEQLWDWGGGAPLVTQYWGGGTKHFFLLILYNFKNIVRPPTPRSLYLVSYNSAHVLHGSRYFRGFFLSRFNTFRRN